MRWPFRRRHELGAAGEWLAARFLFRHGYRLLEQNFRCPGGEIDLIAEDRGTVVFVEVKTRRSLAAGAPEEAVDRRKRRRLRHAAYYYLEAWRRWPPPYRFDVIGIELDEAEHVKDIRHTPSAFGMDEME